MKITLFILTIASFMLVTTHSTAGQNAPPSAGISMEDAIAQANALLRSQGIDPTGEDSHTEYTPLSLSDIKANIDVWPSTVAMLETVDFSSGYTLKRGALLGFVDFHENGEILLDNGEFTFTLPAEFIDLEKRANDIARGKAKAEGYRGRLLDQLDKELYVKQGNALRSASADEIAGADFYLFYHSSQACRWSGRFTPSLVETVEKLENQYPGKIQLIYVSADRNMAELQSQLTTVGTSTALPPMPQWYIDTFSYYHPNIKQINQPSFMLMNANGRLLNSGMRADSDYSSMFQGIETLPTMLANRSDYVPAWVDLAAPLPKEAPTKSSPVAKQPVNAQPDLPIKDWVESSDPTIIGPVPYTSALRDGTPVPGLMLYDSLYQGNRVPALTLQAFPSAGDRENYYVLSFKQVLGKTYSSSRPILVSWFQSTTRPGAQANADLNLLVEQYKAVSTKFNEWRETAVNNRVSNFEKEMFVLPFTQFDHPSTRASFAIPGRDNTPDTDLEIIFKVFDDPTKASFKGENWSLNRNELNAFERLIVQIDTLINNMPAEIARTANALVEEAQKEKDVNALFQ